MIKQLPSAEIEEYVKNNPKSILFDVRTEEEWNRDGKPDGDKINRWMKMLSYNQFTIREIEDGIAFKVLQEQI